MLPELERERSREPGTVLASEELPALAAVLRRQADADVDHAATELLQLAGITHGRQGAAA